MTSSPTSFVSTPPLVVVHVLGVTLSSAGRSSSRPTELCLSPSESRRSHVSSLLPRCCQEHRNLPAQLNTTQQQSGFIGAKCKKKLHIRRLRSGQTHRGQTVCEGTVDRVGLVFLFFFQSAFTKSCDRKLFCTSPPIGSPAPLFSLH